MTAKKKGYEKFEAALNKLERLFAKPTFKGQFKMRVYGVHDGDHKPTEQNYCGTAACLAGWLSMVDPGYAKAVGAFWEHGTLEDRYGFEAGARDYYGISSDDAFNLFLDSQHLVGIDGLKVKLAEARRLVAKEREADKK